MCVFFYASVIVLILLFGGLENLTATYMTDQHVFGMKGSIADSLGYILSVSPNKVLYSWEEISLESGDILSGLFALAIISGIFGGQLELPKLSVVLLKFIRSELIIMYRVSHSKD